MEIDIQRRHIGQREAENTKLRNAFIQFLSLITIFCIDLKSSDQKPCKYRFNHFQIMRRIMSMQVLPTAFITKVT